jgi:hypothetical protein
MKVLREFESLTFRHMCRWRCRLFKCPPYGMLPKWFKGNVWKAFGPKGPTGSNPVHSAIYGCRLP